MSNDQFLKLSEVPSEICEVARALGALKARAEKAERELEIERAMVLESGRRRVKVEHLLAAVLEHGWPPGTSGPACVRAAWAYLRTGATTFDPHDAFSEGYHAASVEIEESRANYEQAKERGLYPNNQEARTDWDRGYDEACACFRLGRNPSEILKMFGPCASPSHTTAALVSAILDGTWHLSTRSDPRLHGRESKPTNWTVGPDGRVNTSPLFCEMVEHVEMIIRDIIRDNGNNPIGGRAEQVAHGIVAKLVHVKGLTPFHSDRSEQKLAPSIEADITPADAIARIKRAAHRRKDFGGIAILSLRVDEQGYRVLYERVHGDGSKSDPLNAGNHPTLRKLVHAIEKQEAEYDADIAETRTSPLVRQTERFSEEPLPVIGQRTRPDTRVAGPTE